MSKHNKPANTHCGIFVRNEKRVQLNYITTAPVFAGGHSIGGFKFKTFGKAIKRAAKMGFTTFETDDGKVLPITADVVALANR